MISALGSAATGLRDALVRLDVAANDIANVSTPGLQPARVVSAARPEGGVGSAAPPADPPLTTGTDVLGGMVNLIVARAAFAANAASLRAAATTGNTLLTLTG
jgi:flagellar basal body rod protein FlgG